MSKNSISFGACQVNFFNHFMSILTIKNNQPTISSEIISNKLGILHRATLQLIKKHQSKIELFGQVAFEMLTVKNSVGAVNEKQICYLNENQAIFVGTLSKNSEKAVQYKAILTQAFSNYKKLATEQIQPTPQTPTFDIREVARQLLVELDDKILVIQEKDRQIEIMQPKVQFIDDTFCEGQTGLTPMKTVAQEIGIGAVKLYKILRNQKVWQYPLNEHGVPENLPMQTQIDNGNFVVKQFWSDRQGKSFDKIFATNKGKLLCYKIVKKDKEQQNTSKFEIILT